MIEKILQYYCHNYRLFIKKLPDKGEKIRNFNDKLRQELQQRDKIEEAAKLLSRLNIVAEGKAAMAEMEWTGKYDERAKNKTEKVVELDSDEDENPLKILAQVCITTNIKKLKDYLKNSITFLLQPTGSGTHKKKIIHIAPKESLIKPEDLEEIAAFKAEPLELEHVNYIVQKTESSNQIQKKEKFKPYKTTKSNVHDPENEKKTGDKLMKIKHWEVTAATPPSID